MLKRSPFAFLAVLMMLPSQLATGFAQGEPPAELIPYVEEAQQMAVEEPKKPAKHFYYDFRNSLMECLTEDEARRKRLPVHMAGKPCDGKKRR